MVWVKYIFLYFYYIIWFVFLFINFLIFNSEYFVKLKKVFIEFKNVGFVDIGILVIYKVFI